MKLLSIETSCDETAFACFEWTSGNEFMILSEQLNSQIDVHKEYGGVYPALAKREHTKNVYPLFIATLVEAQLLKERAEKISIPAELIGQIESILERDHENLERLKKFYETYEIPAVDAIAVTYGPGLEIALWTGFNFARALAVLLDAELVPTNHMEGHIYASLIENIQENQFRLVDPGYPYLSLLISGGHTELIVAEAEHEYTKIGQTLDDAVGEAYDKSARLLGIPYPGGPEISKLAEKYSESTEPLNLKIELPRPMIHSGDYNFSFSGLKTAVRKITEQHTDHSPEFKQALSFELEEAIAEVLIKKSKSAIDGYGPQSFVIGGGVSANSRLRKEFTDLCENQGLNLMLPDRKYTGDNAVMIGIAGYRRLINKKHDPTIDRVVGRLSLENPS